MKSYVKFVFLVLINFCMISSALADICYGVSTEQALKAAEILKDKQEIYAYCSICSEAEPRKIIINKVEADPLFKVNDEILDLAHAYYKDGDEYVNLGIACGCISANQYNVKEKLPDLPLIHQTPENDKAEAVRKVEETLKNCREQNEIKKDFPTTADMRDEMININNCLTSAIEQEINKGFKEEQQKEMKEALKEAKRGVLNFYANIYGTNKYCFNTCGTMSLLLPYADQNDLLLNFLEKIYYLNIAQSGY